MKSFKQIQEESISKNIEFFTLNKEDLLEEELNDLEEAQSLSQKVMMIRRRSRKLKRLLKTKKNIIARKKRLKARRPLSKADLAVRAKKLAKKVLIRKKFGPKIASNWTNIPLGNRVRYNQILQTKYSKAMDKLAVRFRKRIRKSHRAKMRKARAKS